MATGINDLVLVHIDKKPAFYARIEQISPDVKPGWWQVKFLVLTLPLQVYTWILEDAQINGTPFTMGGTPVVMEKVVTPVGEKAATPLQERDNTKQVGAKVISILGRTKEE